MRGPLKTFALGVAKAEGTPQAALGQDYCWMWTNESGASAALQARLRKIR